MAAQINLGRIRANHSRQTLRLFMKKTRELFDAAASAIDPSQALCMCLSSCSKLWTRRRRRFKDWKLHWLPVVSDDNMLTRSLSRPSNVWAGPPYGDRSFEGDQEARQLQATPPNSHVWVCSDDKTHWLW